MCFLLRMMEGGRQRCYALHDEAVKIDIPSSVFLSILSSYAIPSIPRGMPGRLFFINYYSLRARAADLKDSQEGQGTRFTRYR